MCLYCMLEPSSTVVYVPPMQMDATQRSCTVRVELGKHIVRIGVTFPMHYPNGAAPSFIFDHTTSIDISSQQELQRVS